MRTKYLGIESIFVVKNKLSATIACNLILEENSSTIPVYTNIFCHYVHLIKLLKLDNSELSLRVVNDIEYEISNSDKNVVQVDIPEYIDNNTEWEFPLSVNLRKDESHPNDLQCYFLDINEIRKQLN